MLVSPGQHQCVVAFTYRPCIHIYLMIDSEVQQAILFREHLSSVAIVTNHISSEHMLSMQRRIKADQSPDVAFTLTRSCLTTWYCIDVETALHNARCVKGILLRKKGIPLHGGSASYSLAWKMKPETFFFHCLPIRPNMHINYLLRWLFKIIQMVYDEKSG